MSWIKFNEIDQNFLFDLIDVLTQISHETEKTVAQVALNWVLSRPTVSSVVIGARNQSQLIENLGAVGWSLTIDQIKRLDKYSYKSPTYPYWHQDKNPVLNPPIQFYK